MMRPQGLEALFFHDVNHNGFRCLPWQLAFMLGRSNAGFLNVFLYLSFVALDDLIKFAWSLGHADLLNLGVVSEILQIFFKLLISCFHKFLILLTEFFCVFPRIFFIRPGDDFNFLDLPFGRCFVIQPL